MVVVVRVLGVVSLGFLRRVRDGVGCRRRLGRGWRGLGVTFLLSRCAGGGWRGRRVGTGGREKDRKLRVEGERQEIRTKEMVGT